VNSVNVVSSENKNTKVCKDKVPVSYFKTKLCKDKAPVSYFKTKVCMDKVPVSYFKTYVQRLGPSQLL
jgi:hypothetical protein